MAALAGPVSIVQPNDRASLEDRPTGTMGNPDRRGLILHALANEVLGEVSGAMAVRAGNTSVSSGCTSLLDS